VGLGERYGAAPLGWPYLEAARHIRALLATLVEQRVRRLPREQPMPGRELRLIKRWQPFVRQEDVLCVPGGLRGIYVLYRYRRRTGAYNVVYVGMARGQKTGIRSRLKLHRRKKKALWTHFSVFEVWDNIREDEVIELEGLFRQIYGRDQRASQLNKQRSFKKLKRVPRILTSDEDALLGGAR